MTIAASDIRGIQTALNALGQMPALIVDGLLGGNNSATRTALSGFQVRSGLPGTGNVDAATVNALDAAISTGAASTVSATATASASAATTPTVPAKDDVPSVTQSSLVDASTAVDSIVALLEGKLDPIANAGEALVFSHIPIIGEMLEAIAPHAARDALNVAITQAAMMFKSTGNPLYQEAAFIIPAAEQIFTATSGWVTSLGLTGTVSGLIARAGAAVGLKL